MECNIQKQAHDNAVRQVPTEKQGSKTANAHKISSIPQIREVDVQKHSTQKNGP